MPTNRSSIIGVIIAIAFAVLALFAFTRQQQSANSEATAIVNAHAAATSQAISDSGQQTAVAQAQSQGTAQADAQHSEATAVAQANIQATGQAEAQNNEATAVAIAQMQANLAMTAQSEAELAQAAADATGSAAEASVQRAATEVENQAATATVAMGQAIFQADLAQTAVSISIDSATAASEQQQSAQATGTAIRGQNAAVKQTATVQAGALAATQTALIQIAGTLQAPLKPVARVNERAEETMRFLVANQAIENFGGYPSARMDYDVDLRGENQRYEWQRFTGRYSDFVVSAEINWWDGATEDECGFILRAQNDDDFYVVVFSRSGYVDFEQHENNDWIKNYTYKPSSAIHTGLDDMNHVVVVAQGDQFLIYINGQPAGHYVDSNYSDAGQIGVLATTYDNSDQAGCKFSNGWVWDLKTDAPTVTPIMPTAIVAAATSLPAYPVPELSETFTYSDQSFSVDYPDGWTVQEYDDGGMTLSSSSRTYALTNGNAPDEILITLWAAPQTALEGKSLQELVDSIIEGSTDWDDPYDEIIFGEPELFHLGDSEAIRTIATGQNFDFEVVVYGKDQGVFVIYAVCGAGNFGRCEPTIYAIAESTAYRWNPEASDSSFWNIR